MYRASYQGEPLVHLKDEPPQVRDVAGTHHVEIGGLSVAPDGKRAVVVACLDNLLKGAATQAVQNINMALSLPELEGIPHG
jgi:N-acetyl-gamma-glutamyl-phosphate reductase